MYDQVNMKINLRIGARKHSPRLQFYRTRGGMTADLAGFPLAGSGRNPDIRRSLMSRVAVSADRWEANHRAHLAQALPAGDPCRDRPVTIRIARGDAQRKLCRVSRARRLHLYGHAKALRGSR